MADQRDVLTAGSKLVPLQMLPRAHPGQLASIHRFTWNEIDKLRSEVVLPLGLKGVLSADDVERVLEHGADFIWVSNHGGRHFDSTRATIDVLDEIVDQSRFGRVPVIC